MHLTQESNFETLFIKIIILLPSCTLRFIQIFPINHKLQIKCDGVREKTFKSFSRWIVIAEVLGCDGIF